MTAPADLFSLLLSDELVAALDEHIREVVAEAIEQERARQPKRWLPVTKAAKEMGCTPEALRMRCKRGSVEYYKQGRLLYVRVDPTDNGAEVPCDP